MTKLQFPRKPYRRDLHHSDYSIMRPLCFTLLHSIQIIKSFNLFIMILFTFIWIIKLITKILIINVYAYRIRWIHRYAFFHGTTDYDSLKQQEKTARLTFQLKLQPCTSEQPCSASSACKLKSFVFCRPTQYKTILEHKFFSIHKVKTKRMVYSK